MKIVSILLLALMLSACSTQNQTQTNEQADANVTASATSPADGPVAIGERCGTIANLKCGDEAFCDIEHPATGLDLSGTCVARPEACPDIAMDPMACGRDGKRYATECHANAVGVDIVTEGVDVTCEE